MPFSFQMRRRATSHCLLLRLLLLRLDVLQEFSVHRNMRQSLRRICTYTNRVGWVHRVARAHTPWVLAAQYIINQQMDFLGFNVLHEILLVFAAGVDWWRLLLVLAGGHGEECSDERGAQGGHGELEAHKSVKGLNECILANQWID